jgi:hypothetical protein
VRKIARNGEVGDFPPMEAQSLVFRGEQQQKEFGVSN